MIEKYLKVLPMTKVERPHIDPMNKTSKAKRAINYNANYIITCLSIASAKK
jgi:hypothetical protein